MSRELRFLSNAPETTQRIGRALGNIMRPGDVVCLLGPLGAGKTCFIQGMVRGIHPQGTYPVRSPSFTIVSEYPGPKPIYHIDLFRIGSGPGDAETGVEDLFGGDGFYLIEWADRCPHWLPAERLDVELEILGPSGRSLVFRTLGKRWREALKLLEAKIEETL